MLMFLALVSSAFAQTPTIAIDTRGPYADGYAHKLVITATSVTTSTELTINRGPRCGDIIGIGWSLDAGTGTTLRPRIGTEAAFTADGFRQVLYASAAAAEAREVGSAPYCHDGALYIRPGVNAGSDNEVTIEMLIGEGVKQ